mmetsp:Transcript_45478/g.120981  ORF Transcript_45478/g.120981 Transcript_45478/m.120981 type:complete len:86 (-) Transcript_45478:617-874(-)
MCDKDSPLASTSSQQRRKCSLPQAVSLALLILSLLKLLLVEMVSSLAACSLFLLPIAQAWVASNVFLDCQLHLVAWPLPGMLSLI